jgi:hypothetical protein
LVEEVLPFPDGQFVIETRHPTLTVIEVRKALFCGEVVAVLWPGRIAADLRLVVNGFAEGIGT